MESCCTVELGPRPAPAHCPECGKPGRAVERITVKALLHPAALERLSAPEHRFCATPGCPVVYFGNGETFDRGDVRAPVFQKEPAGGRTVCYCFAVSEEDIRRELEETGRSSASDRITDLVKKDRCACEVRNPQGSCCLGNVALVTRAPQGRPRRPDAPPYFPTPRPLLQTNCGLSPSPAQGSAALVKQPTVLSRIQP